MLWETLNKNIVSPKDFLLHMKYSEPVTCFQDVACWGVDPGSHKAPEIELWDNIAS